MDEVYIHIAELITPEWIPVADLQNHAVCFPEYMNWKNENKRKITIKRYQIPTLFKKNIFKGHVKAMLDQC